MMRKIRVGEGSALTKRKPKQLYRYISLLAVLTSMCLYARAQEDIEWTPAASGQSKLPSEGLQVGDSIPDELWNMPLTLWKAADNSTKTITLTDYRGKVIILDFWATWCGTCLTLLPHQVELGHAFLESASLLPITSERQDYIEKFFASTASDQLTEIHEQLYSVVNGASATKYFPTKTLPHTVIINREGLVEAITTPDYLNADYLEKLLANVNRYIPNRHSLNRAASEGLLNWNQNIKARPYYRSTYYTAITGEIEGLAERFIHTVDSVNGSVRTLIANSTVIDLYAAGEYPGTVRDFPFLTKGSFNRRIMEVKDPTLYHYYFDDSLKTRTTYDVSWRRKHRFTYESIMPLRPGYNYKRDLVCYLNTFFGLEGNIERRSVPLLVLRLNDHFDKTKHRQSGRLNIVLSGWKNRRLAPDSLAGPNEDGYTTYLERMKMKSIPKQLAGTYNILLKGDLLLPTIIDETGLDPDFKISIGLPDDEGTSLENLQQALYQQGFDLIEEKREIELFVLKEKGYENPPGGSLVLTQFGYVPEINLKHN